MSVAKSPKLFKRIFRSTEDVRQGRATPIFPRRKKTAKTYANGVETTPGMLGVGFPTSKVSRASIDEEEDEDSYRLSASDAENDASVAVGTPPVAKKKVKRYRRFTQKYITWNRKAKSADDDKIYKARSSKMKHKALEINL